MNGERVKARKKTNNKRFETQDAIAYWGDFARPKIVYPSTEYLENKRNERKQYHTKMLIYNTFAKHD